MSRDDNQDYFSNNPNISGPSNNFPRRTSISSVKSSESNESNPNSDLRGGQDASKNNTTDQELNNQGDYSKPIGKTPPHSMHSRSYRSRPTSSNGSLKGHSPSRRKSKSSYLEDEDDLLIDDTNDETDDSKKRNRRKTLRKRRSRKPSHNSASNIILDQDGDNNDTESSESEREVTLKDIQDAINNQHPFGLRLWKPALYKKSRTVTRNADSALHSIPTSQLYLYPGNIIWTILFGWWLALVSFIVSMFLLFTPYGGQHYSRVLRELSFYIFWPFGKYVERTGEWWEDEEDRTHENNNGDLHNDLTANGDYEEDRPLLGRRTSYGDFPPSFLLVSSLCWFGIFSIPMAKLTYKLTILLREQPLNLHFKSGSFSNLSKILLCTTEAIGFQYYKYTYEGINIIFIDLIPIVFFAIFDNFLFKMLSNEILFTFSLLSVIPLSYFIGMAVASISAQSSIGLGAVINATFGSIVEIILYAVALTEGRGKLTEGCIIGSFAATVLLMPGLSMVCSGLKRKEQRFNLKSAGVTSTMLIMAIIGALTPTLFYQIYAPYQLICKTRQCEVLTDSCQECEHTPLDPITTGVYKEHVKPLMYFSAAILVLSYLIGLWFSLRTHASLVWQTTHQHQGSTDNQDNQECQDHQTRQSLYKRLSPLQLLQQLLPLSSTTTTSHQNNPNTTTERPMSAPSQLSQLPTHNVQLPLPGPTLYSLIAEILVSNVDVIQSHFIVTEKFLGLTLFALVPSATEFVNAMAFALYGNIALSMEIGSAYALQICLLQIPAMVAFSAWYNYGKTDLAQIGHTFTWDAFVVVFSVFLLTYTYIEGKSNYFKGSILILSYLVLIAGFYCAPILQSIYNNDFKISNTIPKWYGIMISSGNNDDINNDNKINDINNNDPQFIQILFNIPLGYPSIPLEIKLINLFSNYINSNDFYELENILKDRAKELSSQEEPAMYEIIELTHKLFNWQINSYSPSRIINIQFNAENKLVENIEEECGIKMEIVKVRNYLRTNLWNIENSLYLIIKDIHEENIENIENIENNENYENNENNENNLNLENNENNEKICKICLDKCLKLTTFLPCNHIICDDCLIQYLSIKISENQIFLMNCPGGLKCRTLVDPNTIGRLLSIQLINKYYSCLHDSFIQLYKNPEIHKNKINTIKTFSWCINPRCHWPASCLDHETYLVTNHTVKISNKKSKSTLLEIYTKPCPKCRILISKNGGCMHMICGICNYQFCWGCLVEWTKRSHTTYFACDQVSNYDNNDSDDDYVDDNFGLTRFKVFDLDDIQNSPGQLQKKFKNGVIIHSTLMKQEQMKLMKTYDSSSNNNDSNISKLRIGIIKLLIELNYILKFSSIGLFNKSDKLEVKNGVEILQRLEFGLQKIMYCSVDHSSEDLVYRNSNYISISSSEGFVVYLSKNEFGTWSNGGYGFVYYAILKNGIKWYWNFNKQIKNIQICRTLPDF
ncbi:5654_t:CDS:10 [Diversispora eburnea]|uniref:RBR-type E3 ubiquitin transferase n=1 Tax=Diversispora eburnea TaxID=1213867 RepID=A0A9N8ZGC0_9GLOM|nr:5654_t:CDS:10 [Diversispora eburnea]